MKRKIILALMALTCASAMAFGLAACDTGGGNKKPGGNSSNTDPPNYPPPNNESSELLNFELSEDKKSYIVTGLADGVTNANITIPAVYNSLPVTEIGERAFGSCHTLTSVTISSGITTIGSGAFTDCINIPTFKFPASITKIDDSAFQNCSGLRALRFSDGSLLEEISSNAFQNCTALSAIDIPDNVVTVGDRVFQGCSALKSVKIGDGVEAIGVETFRGCTKLAKVEIGNSLKTVGEKAFLNCTEITEMHFPLSLESVGLGALDGCTGIKTLTLPFVGSEKYDEPVPADKEYSSDNHTNFGYIFGASSFHDNNKLTLDNLETLTITGDSPIGYHAFQSIGRFADSTETKGIGLKTVIITGSVKVIGTGAFQGCFNLQTLVIPKSVTKIGSEILEPGVIKHVYYEGTKADWSNVDVNSANMALLGTSGTDPRYYYSETQPAESGKFWHYVDGEPTPWN